MFRDTTIKRRTEWAPGLVSLVLDGLTPPFVPGQFFQLGVRGPDGELIRRSYSAASAPGQRLEFLLSEVPGGALTPKLCALSAGDGFFTLAEVPVCDTLWLVATGTGLGPFLSMLRAKGALERFNRVVVVHGAHEQARLAHADEVRALTQGQGARYVPCVSREEPPPGGLRGRVTDLLSKGELEAAAGAPIDTHAHVLLCGNPAMIDDMVGLLRARGLEKHRRRAPGHFNFEKYWS
jgi:ferredoxin/flavodoxin---NADP+ reductase